MGTETDREVEMVALALLEWLSVEEEEVLLLLDIKTVLAETDVMTARALLLLFVLLVPEIIGPRPNVEGFGGAGVKEFAGDVRSRGSVENRRRRQMRPQIIFSSKGSPSRFTL